MKRYLFIVIAIVGLAGFAAKTHATNCLSVISGTETISASCTFTATTTDGVDGGITIATGQTLTISSGQTIVFDPGSSFIIQSGATLVIVGTGQLRKADLWMVDNDHDGWPATTIVTASLASAPTSSPGSNYARLNGMLSRTVVDCNDNIYSLANSCSTTPGAPTIGTATAGNGSASVAFTPGATNGATVTGYVATSNPGGFTSSGCASSPCTVSGLTNGTSYTFTVHTTSNLGNSPSSAASNAVTPAGAPGIPTGLTITQAITNVHISWTAPSANGSAITSYKIYRSTTSGGEAYLASSASASYVDGSSGVTNTYYYKVSAVNGIGEGSLSSEAQATCQNGYSDLDGDGYGAGSAIAVCAPGTSRPSGYSSNNTDCNDNAAAVYQMATAATDADQDGYIAGSGFSTECVGPSTSVSGRAYYQDAIWNYSQLLSGQQKGYNDCNDSNSSLYQNLTEYVDNDGDGYGTPGAAYGTSLPVQKCSGATLVLDPGYVANETDCYDVNSNAYPGSSYWGTGVRGISNDPAGNSGFSYDYNCDGQQTALSSPFLGSTGSCVAAADSACGNTCPGQCQTLSPGRRLDYAPSPCTTGALSCGACTAIWTAGVLYPVTQCNACNYWGTMTEACQ
jgi:hypothetical protein